MDEVLNMDDGRNASWDTWRVVAGTLDMVKQDTGGEGVVWCGSGLRDLVDRDDTTSCDSNNDGESVSKDLAYILGVLSTEDSARITSDPSESGLGP